MRQLVLAGANAEFMNQFLETLFKLSCGQESVAVVAELLSASGEKKGWERSGEVVVNGTDESSLWSAAFNGHSEVVRYLRRDEVRPRTLVQDKARITLSEFLRHMPEGRSGIAIFNDELDIAYKLIILKSST